MTDTAIQSQAAGRRGPDLGIVIVNWNVRDLLAGCLDSVYTDLAQAGGALTGVVCVVDNDSSDGSTEMVQSQFPSTQLIVAENRGMGAGNNRGLRALADQYQPFAFMVLNPDTVLRPGALRSLVDFLRANPRAGVAAPKLLYPDGRLQHAGFRFPGFIQALFDLYPPPARLARLIDSPLNGRYPASLYQGGSPFPVDHTLGAAFVVRAEAAAECGWFDETFQMYCEEIDWQWRMARAGWERWVVPAAEIVHYAGQSTAQVKAESLARLWTSRRRLYVRYHTPALNAVLNPLVRLAMRQRIRANHRRSQRGEMAADERAALNQALGDVIRVWQQRRPPI
jgi:N-acetylglucosaminyl-diphospho-decaprenol L-rhamnosyltransferase